jgi:hypothetical protein
MVSAVSLVSSMVVFAVLGNGGVVCPQGTFLDPLGRCSWCGEGSYQDEIGAVGCKNCRRGMYSKEIAAISPSACQNCPPGKYATNSSACGPCPIDTTSPAGAFDIQECIALAGYFGVPGAAAQKCPAEHYCVQGTAIPTPCQQGMTSPPGATQCKPGTQAILLYDWVFSVAWLALFFPGSICLGAYKMIRECTSFPTHSKPPGRQIKIHVTRRNPSQTTSSHENKHENV